MEWRRAAKGGRRRTRSNARARRVVSREDPNGPPRAAPAQRQGDACQAARLTAAKRGTQQMASKPAVRPHKATTWPRPWTLASSIKPSPGGTVFPSIEPAIQPVAYPRLLRASLLS